jgi:hypothetical protein
MPVLRRSANRLSISSERTAHGNKISDFAPVLLDLEAIAEAAREASTDRFARSLPAGLSDLDLAAARLGGDMQLTTRVYGGRSVSIR